MAKLRNCQGKQALASAAAYRKTTTATTMERISTTTASTLTWLASHDSFGGGEELRKAGTNSAGAGSADPGWRWRLFSQSTQRVRPSETGNPQDAHFCTRRIASGTGPDGASGTTS